MKKERLFRADGDPISTADFVGKNGLQRLQAIDNLVISARVTKGNLHRAAVAFNKKFNGVLVGSSSGDGRRALEELKALLPEGWLPERLTEKKLHGQELELRGFENAKQCALLVNRLNACKALYLKVKANGVTTTDPRYSGGGAELSCTMGGAQVTFMSTFDDKAFNLKQENVVAQADADNAVAAAQQAQAEADLASEKARNTTAIGRTLRIVGLCAVAVLVAVMVVIIIKHSKKH